MIDLKEKTDDIKELEIPEIKKENNEENIYHISNIACIKSA